MGEVSAILHDLVHLFSYHLHAVPAEGPWLISDTSPLKGTGRNRRPRECRISDSYDSGESMQPSEEATFFYEEISSGNLR